MEETHVSATDLKVTDLKKELEKRGLSKSGNKAQLIDRLKKGLEKEGETLDSIFGAQVCAQKSSASISGSDMARWCSQIVKKDSNTQSGGQPDGVGSPVVSPTPPVEHNTPQPPPQPSHPFETMVEVPSQVNDGSPFHMPNKEVAQEEVPPQAPQISQPTEQQPVDTQQNSLPAIQTEITPSPPPVETEVVQQEEPAQPEPIVANEQTPATVEPSNDLLPTQPAYSEPLLLESDARMTFSSPLSVQEQEKLSDDERDEEKRDENKQQEDVDSKPPTSVIDPAMLVPRRQLRLSEKRQLETATNEVTLEVKRKRKWSEEVSTQPTCKGAVISSESLKLMNLPDVSDVEEVKEKETPNRDLDRSGTRRRRFVDSGDAAAENTKEVSAPAAELQRVDGGGTDDGEMMDTLELTIEEKGDDLGGDDLGSGGESAKKPINNKPANQPASNRKSSTVTAPVPLDVDEPRRTKRNPSPARSEPTNILHVENLVRPFSLGQLKELLSRVGTVDESLFWTDKVKSHCIVGYKNLEDAVKTREALHGTQWPSTNPKILSVDFVTTDFLERHKNMEEGSTRLTGANIGGVGIALGGPTARSSRLVKASVSSENGVAPIESITSEKSSRHLKASTNGNLSDASSMRRLVKTNDNSNKNDPESNAPLRDRQVVTSRTESKHKERRNKPDTQQQQQQEKPEKQQEQSAEPVKPRVSLDDLFRRTKTVPHLYWLPLTDEEIESRDLARKEREKEREALERQHEKEREQREKERAKERELREKEREQREKERELREKEREQREKEREQQREKERAKEREREMERQRELQKEREYRSRDRQDRERQSTSRQPDRRDYSDSRQRRSSPVDQSRGGRRSSPRRPPIDAAPAVPFREPVTPPPFRSRQSRSRSRNRSSSRSGSDSSASHSRSSSRSSKSSSASSRSRSSSSADSRDRRRRR